AGSSGRGDFFFKEGLLFDGDSMGVATPDYSGVLQRSLELKRVATPVARRWSPIDGRVGRLWAGRS
ncbi:hypothetical protein NFC73_20370, partial [Pseudarthrobacter sp. RMG13]